MHRIRVSSPLVLSAALFLGVASTLPTFASPAPKLHRLTFELRNIKPSLLAYWLDPAHQEAPIELRMERHFDTYGEWTVGQPATTAPTDSFKAPVPRPRLPGNVNGPVGLKLPDGITRVVALDPQNALLVTGTQGGLEALGKLLPTLDVPLVQYEVEARFYRVNLADLPATGLHFDPDIANFGNDGDNFGSATVLAPDFETRIASLVDAKRAVLLTAPRVLGIDGLSAHLSQSTSWPAVWNETPLPGKGSQPAQRVAMLSTSNGIYAQVTRLEKDLIEVAVEPHWGNRVLSVTATVGDEQPFAIRMSPATDARQLIVVVNTRRIRRSVDDK